jgi:hypothetical protein
MSIFFKFRIGMRLWPTHPKGNEAATWDGPVYKRFYFFSLNKNQFLLFFPISRPLIGGNLNMLCNNIDNTVLRMTTPVELFVTVSKYVLLLYWLWGRFGTVHLFLTELGGGGDFLLSWAAVILPQYLLVMNLNIVFYYLPTAIPSTVLKSILNQAKDHSFLTIHITYNIMSIVKSLWKSLVITTDEHSNWLIK